MNGKASEFLGLVGVIDPDVLTAATHTSGWIDASKYHRYLAVLSVGTMGSSATIDAKIEQATNSSGGSAKDVSNTSITQLTQAGTDSDKQVLINLDCAELDLANDFDHFRLSVTVGTASCDGGATVFGFLPRNGPANDNDASTVDEIVN